MESNNTTKKFFDAVLFREIWSAMKVTLKHMLHRPITFQYPREKRKIPDAHRGALGLLRYDNGQERCVGCDLCEVCLLYTSPSPRDLSTSRMPSSA